MKGTWTLLARTAWNKYRDPLRGDRSATVSAPFLINGQARQRGDFGAGGDDYVLGADGAAAAVQQCHLHLALTCQLPPPLHILHLRAATCHACQSAAQQAWLSSRPKFSWSQQPGAVRLLRQRLRSWHHWCIPLSLHLLKSCCSNFSCCLASLPQRTVHWQDAFGVPMKINLQVHPQAMVQQLPKKVEQ